MDKRQLSIDGASLMTPFHAVLTAHEISHYAYAQDRLVAAFASANIAVYPHQVAAAQFALRSEYLKGIILADEGGLGKTMEALLVLSQFWFEGKEKILLVVPTPLLTQWTRILECNFAVPYAVVGRDNPDFAQEGIVLTTYEIASDFAEQVSAIVWNVAAFDEAHRLNKPENKLTVALKAAVGDAFKILLTATPMQNSIMDLYGLIAFIDEIVLPDADIFYKRYFRKPERYGELAAVISRYAFRTLRSQARRFVNLPRRLPVTADYKQTAAETKLAAMVSEYLNKPSKAAFPKMDDYECALMFWKALSSSTAALLNLLDGTLERTDELREMRNFAADIQTTAKGGELVKAIKKAFVELKKRGANRKILIFTEYKATQKYLAKLLSGEFNVTTDYDKFTEADILVTTDVAAEGFNFGFCSFVVNYDMPYTVLALEQRIMRCHRQGQKNDVIVLNFLSKSNFADVRMLELINKRVLQFDGIMGLSDDLVGNFCLNALDGITAAFSETRTHKQIEADYAATLKSYENENAAEVEAAENVLFTTFTRDIAEKVTVTPKYIKDRADEMNAKLWKLTKWFFANKSGYTFDEDTKTLHIAFQAQKVFTGAALRRREYSLRDKTLSPVSSIAKNMIHEIFWRGIPDSGEVTVENIEHTTRIGYYNIKVKARGDWHCKNYFTLVGRCSPMVSTLTDAECREIMVLPILNFTAGGAIYGERDGLSKPKTSDSLDVLVDAAVFIKRAALDYDDKRRGEAHAIADRAYYRKQALNREVEVLKTYLRQAEMTLARTNSAADKLLAEKRKAKANKNLKQLEQSLFMEGLRIDAEAEAAIAEMTANADLTAEVTRYFTITIN